jgi:hypothetical protein
MVSPIHSCKVVMMKWGANYIIANKAGPFGGVIAFQMVASAQNVTAAVVSPAARANARTDMNAAIGATMAKRFVA